MSYDAAAIRDAIRDVLTGALGSVRSMAGRDMDAGVFEGQNDSARHAKALLNTHRFDVRIGRLRSHESSPVGAIGSHRIAVADITVSVLTATATVVQLTERDELIADVLSDLEQASQALSFPGNLRASDAGNATGIVSGLMLGPGGEGYPEVAEVSQDWQAQEIRSSITGQILILVSQSTAVETLLTALGDSLVGWWQSDQGVTDALGSVSAWADLSGNSNTLSTAATPKPILTASGGQNDRPFISTAAITPSRLQRSGAVFAADDVPSVFVVGRFAALDSGQRYMFSATSEALSSLGVIACGKSASHFITMGSVSTLTTTTIAADTSVHLFQFVHDGANHRVRVDDGGEYASAAGLVASASDVVSVPHALTASVPTFDYYAIVATRTALTSGQIESIRSYFNDFYDLGITP